MPADKESRVSYTAYKGYEYSIKRLERFHDMDIEDITARDIQRFYEYMNAQMYSKETIQKTKSALIQTYKYAVFCGCNVSLDMLNSISVPKNAVKTVSGR